MKSLLKLTILIPLFALVGHAQKPDSSAKPAVNEPVATIKLPDAKEIFAKYVKALGGRDALLKHKSRYDSGTMEMSPMGLKGKFESFARSDDRVFTKVSLDGIGEILEGFDGTTAWTSNPIQGSRLKEGKELEQVKSIARFSRDADLEKIYSSVRVTGVEKVADRDAYVVVGSTDGLPDEILYFDVENGLMVRLDRIVISPEGRQATSTFLEDYRDIGGVRTPFKTRVKTPAFEITSLTTEVKYDVDIDDSKFKRPN